MKTFAPRVALNTLLDIDAGRIDYFVAHEMGSLDRDCDVHAHHHYDHHDDDMMMM
jgi:hypothetical protein